MAKKKKQSKKTAKGSRASTAPAGGRMKTRQTKRSGYKTPKVRAGGGR